MDAVAGVVLQVVQVEQGGFGEVVVGELEVAHFCGHGRLDARRQRRVTDGEPLVEREVAGLLLGGEVLAGEEQGHHEVGLFDDLLAIQVEVRVMQQQRVVSGGVESKSQPRAR